MARVIYVHGIRTKGEDSIDKLGRELVRRGHIGVNYDYQNVNLLHTLFALRAGQKRGLQYDRAKNLVSASKGLEKASVIAHSFGCLVTLRAMELGARFNVVYWFAPAMDKDFIIPVWGCDWLVIVHNPEDKAIKAGSRLLNHDFGEMGLTGSIYEGLDWRIRNYKDTSVSSSADFLNHNYAFKTEGRVHYWADFFERALHAYGVKKLDDCTGFKRHELAK